MSLMSGPVNGQLKDSPDTGAIFSPDRLWRYILWRYWEPARPPLMVVGLNPSTADELTDDPTIRRCIGYSKRWGYGGLWMLNLFAFRATDPRDMKAATDPVGSENDKWLSECSDQAAMVLAAWGAHGSFGSRDRWVHKLLTKDTVRPIFSLGTTKDGSPRHPLYLRNDALPIPWRPRHHG